MVYGGMAQPAYVHLTGMGDEELVRCAKGGCKPATERLLTKYRSLVEGKAKAYFLAGADHEDVVQEGMIGLFKAIRDFSHDNLSAFRSFAELCITRHIITAVKAAARQKHIPLNSYMSIDVPVADDECGTALRDIVAAQQRYQPENLVVGRELGSAVRSYITRELSPLEAEALLRYIDGQTYHDIARTLGRDVKQIDNALQRAKKKMERNLTTAARFQ
jgi:RNA polymerase sporulation-specific sigma factor